MNSPNRHKILLIGGPNAGKTHFGGQLYGRLSSKESSYKIVSTPDDLSIFKEVNESLYNGISADHTPVSIHKELPLDVIDREGQVISISIPDYGGEQIKEIVTLRKLNAQWQKQIIESTAWMLFIRLDDVSAIEDIVNRGLPDIDELNKRKSAGLNNSNTISDQSFYIELMQVLLYAKGISTLSPIKLPQLTVILSCWDTIPEASANALPSEILLRKLPLLFHFLTQVWSTRALRILGLSSTEKTLSRSEPDLGYIEKGPEEFGYYVLPNGKVEKDLTHLIGTVIGN